MGCGIVTRPLRYDVMDGRGENSDHAVSHIPAEDDDSGVIAIYRVFFDQSFGEQLSIGDAPHLRGDQAEGFGETVSPENQDISSL